jgi:hypothetical protein
MLLAACHNSALGPDGTKPCSDIKTLGACEADPSCMYAGCPSCDGSGQSFEVCYTRGDSPPGFGCPGGCPASCGAHEDLASCNADPTCSAIQCCGPGSFNGCFEKNAPPPIECTPNVCVAPVCPSITTEAACNAATGCYSVLTAAHPEPCDNSSCSVGFDHCEGGIPTCAVLEGCEGASQPTCPAPYENDYDASTGCIIGCVQTSACPTN